ncbi:MAG: S41 family peptidase [Phycisphaerae bacterium]|nr:S41 family peptidase [Phycisphaerae bacterium]MDD5381488.1 S41 family peptidase [Phycisphaerae bacterium]
MPKRPAPVEIPKAGTADANAVKTACELIAEGKFDTAGELINSAGSREAVQSQLSQLAEIVQEYKDITEHRKSAREDAYAERLAELEKLWVAAEANDVSDVNDVNDISKAMSVIAKVSEFADKAQKAELLSEPFTQQSFQKAIDKASELESKGKWLDAYAICYSWLQVIDENNTAYSDHAEQLIEKANIAALFQDSPCESRKERFENVKKEMFTRSIEALRLDYVSSIIDYRQMAIKAVKRCELLAEVTNLSPEARRSLAESDVSSDENRLSAWSRGLKAILDEIENSPMEVSKDKFIAIFEKVLTLNTTTVELPTQLLITQFAEAALSALDPYTVIVWPKQTDDFEKMMTNEFTGIGIEISKEKGQLTVSSLLPDTPAYYSGLDAEDMIENIDGVETKDMSLSCAVKNITGKAGTQVRLTIRRAGEDETRDITITRAKITVPTIRGWERTETGKWLYMIDTSRKIGYVHITSFSEKTASDFEDVLNQLEAEGLNGLILDLRFNSGGLLNMAIEVADKFLEEGPIVITRPRSWVSSTYAWARKEGTHPNYPLVILINSYSASASEIVAGALADPLHNRAVLVGERTHGKGSVQGIISYPKGGAQLKYTMAYYYLPSGQRVKSQDEVKKEGKDDWGVGPAVEVKLRSDEIKKMFDVQRDNDVLVRADRDKEAAPLKKHTVEESLAADPQLTVGLLVVRSKLIEESSEIRK